MFRPTQLDQLEALKQLAKAFGDLGHQPQTNVSIIRTLQNGAVQLPEHSGFCKLASQGGKLLAELPNHWRFGVQARTMDEPHPAKRWVSMLFDYAVAGLVDVPNWDNDNEQERIDDTFCASVMACHVLLRFSERPNWGKGNLGAAIELAKARADEFLEKTRQERSPVLAAFHRYLQNALRSACAIATMSRNPNRLLPSQFVHTQTSLDECLIRIDQLTKTSDVLRQWPTTPGTTFSWKAGDSAMHVALQFAQAIRAATGYTRMQTVGNLGHEPPDLRVAEPNPAPEIIKWREATLKELQEHTLPSVPAWPAWEIGRDEQRLASLLRDEYRRITTSKGNDDTAGAETENIKQRHTVDERRTNTPYFDSSNQPSADAQARFEQAWELVRQHPAEFESAGKWLDGLYSNQALRDQRCQEHRDYRRRLKSNYATSTRAAWRKSGKDGPSPTQSRWSRDAQGKRQCKVVSKYERIQSAWAKLRERLQKYQLKSREKDERIDLAKRVVLLTWLLTDPDAHQFEHQISAEFQDWPWQARTPMDKEGQADEELRMYLPDGVRVVGSSLPGDPDPKEVKITRDQWLTRRLAQTDTLVRDATTWMPVLGDAIQILLKQWCVPVKQGAIIAHPTIVENLTVRATGTTTVQAEGTVNVTRAAASPKGGRSSQGEEKWRDAQEKLLNLLDNGRLSKGLTIEEAGGLVGHKKSTTRTAIMKSDPLKQHFGLGEKDEANTQSGVTGDGELLSELSQPLRSVFRNLPDGAQDQMEKLLRSSIPDERKKAKAILQVMKETSDPSPSRGPSVGQDGMDISSEETKGHRRKAKPINPWNHDE